MLINVACRGCGKPMVLDSTKATESAPGVYCINTTLTCPQCGNVHAEQETVLRQKSAQITTVGGDFVGRDKISTATTVVQQAGLGAASTHIAGDVAGPVLSGAFAGPISVGSLTDVVGTAIGHGAQVNVTTTRGRTTLLPFSNDVHKFLLGLNWTFSAPASYTQNNRTLSSQAAVLGLFMRNPVAFSREVGALITAYRRGVSVEACSICGHEFAVKMIPVEQLDKLAEFKAIALCATCEKACIQQEIN